KTYVPASGSTRRRATDILGTMGTIINLYVIPRQQDPNNLQAAQAAETIVSEHLVAPPLVIGPALMAHDRLLSPQRAYDPYWLRDLGASITAEHADFIRRSQRFVELPRTFTDFGRTDEPQIAAFTRLDETNPAIRSDFSHYTGVECSVGLYVARRGFRLLLEDPNFNDVPSDVPPVYDGTLFQWMHLQGKAAPWLAQYLGSCF